VKMYTIGELAAISDISAKTLRFYDQEGLLQPEIRNATTGYRYYSEKQLLQLILIKELKTFGLSLEDIQNVIDKKDHEYLKTTFHTKIVRLEQETEQLSRQLQSTRFAYQRLIECCDMLSNYGGELREDEFAEGQMYPVTISVLPELWVLATRGRNTMNVDQLFLERCLELQKLSEQYGLYHAGPLLGIFHDGYASQFTKEYGDLELCLPVIRPPGGLAVPGLKLMESLLCAGTVHAGHYKYSYRAYLTLLEWIEKSAYRITGPPMESYLLDPCNTVNPHQYITRILFPIELKETGVQEERQA